MKQTLFKINPPPSECISYEASFWRFLLSVTSVTTERTPLKRGGPLCFPPTHWCRGGRVRFARFAGHTAQRRLLGHQQVSLFDTELTIVLICFVSYLGLRMDHSLGVICAYLLCFLFRFKDGSSFGGVICVLFLHCILPSFEAAKPPH